MNQVDIVHLMAQINETIEIFHRNFYQYVMPYFLSYHHRFDADEQRSTFQIKIVFKINVNNYNRHTNNAVTLMIQFQGHRSHNQKFTIEMFLLFALQKSSSFTHFKTQLFHFIIICEVFLFSFINIILIFPFSSIKYVFIHFKCITHLHILPVNRQLVYLDLDRGPDSMTFRLYSFQCPRNCNQFYYGN